MKRVALILTLLLAPIHSANSVDIPEYCADTTSFQIRTSNVIERCEANEISLGVGALNSSPTAPKKLNETLENRFQIAQGAALQDGVNLQITSGYRTIERQTYLFNQAVRKYGSYKSAAKWVAPPELSHHPLGLAIDVNYPENPNLAKWLEINGYKFGLCRVFKNEWWHFEGNIAPGQKCPKMYKNALALLKS
jgi:LAS superfamily LD-carboxypeptidase LdcB